MSFAHLSLPPRCPRSGRARYSRNDVQDWYVQQLESTANGKAQATMRVAACDLILADLIGQQHQSSAPELQTAAPPLRLSTEA